MKTFRDWSPRQEWLLPPSPGDWLPEGHLVYCVLDLVEDFDLSGMVEPYRVRDARGERAYHPGMMTALLLYGYATGMPSSRKLERATYEDVAIRFLTGGNHPDHTRISEFRRVNLEKLAGLFVQMFQVCQKAGLVKLGHVALDGTKVKANASKHKAMSYDRMLKTERELANEVKKLLERAEQVDAQEDRRFGKGNSPEDLPEELRRRGERLARIRKAREELEAEAAEQQSKTNQPPPGSGGGKQLPHHRVPSKKDGTPTAKAQRNFTDPESRIMKHQGGYIQGYNGQIAVDEETQVIVAHGLTNQPPDVEHLEPMLDLIEANTGKRPKRLTADAGYWSAENSEACTKRNIQDFIATGRLKHGEEPPAVRGRPPKNLDAKGRMWRKLRTKKGQAIYARRKAVVEPCFGQIKQRGFWKLLLRGLENAQGEWALIATSHNLLKYYRFGWHPA